MSGKLAVLSAEDEAHILSLLQAGSEANRIVIKTDLNVHVLTRLYYVALGLKARLDESHEHYTSTYCIHALHAECRRECKVCSNGCLCPCHAEVEHE